MQPGASRSGRIERSCAQPPHAGRPPAAIERLRVRMHGEGYAMHAHDSYAVGVTLGGVQAFWFRGARRYSLPGQVLVIHPGEPHDGANGDAAPLDYLMLYVTPAALRSAAEDERPGPLPFVAEAVRNSIPIRAIVAEAFEAFPAPLSDLAEADLLGQLARALDAEGAAPRRTASALASNAAMLARDLLANEGAGGVTAARLEAASGVSRYALARQFRAAFGISPHQYLLGRRLREARRLIAAGEPLAATAQQCGFADQSHLTRRFVSRFGLTPGRFQAQCKAGRIAIGD